MNAVLVSLIWVTLAAPTAPPLAEDVAFQEGVTLYEDFEYEKSVFRFKQALRVEDRAPKDKATIAIRLGMTYAELRDLTAAAAAFDTAIENDPLVTLPLDAPPKIQRMVDKARVRARDKPPVVETPAPDETPLVDTAPMEPDPTSAVEEPVTGGTPPDDGGLPWILIGGGGVAVAGLVIALLGAAAWGGGVGLAAYASSQNFQDEAASLALPSSIGQIGGQVALGAGAVVLVVGAAVAVVGLVLE